MTILITGGASQIGSLIAQGLKEAGKNVVFGSRSGRVPDGFESVKLDWLDVFTLQNPFSPSSIAPITGVYILMPPGHYDPSDNIKRFIDLAVDYGVNRFVLLGGSAADKDPNSSYGMIKVWLYLDQKNLDYFVLRPTWFMENMHEIHGKSIRENDEIRSVMPTAKIPMVAVTDIAQVGIKAFLAEKNDRTDQRIIGPELLSYDQVAEILSDVLGRKITHKIVTSDALTTHYETLLGWPVSFAKFLVHEELNVEKGSEERWWGAPENANGKETFREWAQKNKSKLQP